ncbi:MAG: NAD-dependent epimerase/dehydratase family protein [Bacillota bacterium]|nr:MAG: NAD-dependent epimerase/dehydratase family protein [Bacillota bacterium]
MSEQRYVLTGGTGFIMSYVAERLAAMGKDVVLYDNCEEHELFDYTTDLLSRHANVKYVKGDIRDKDAVNETIKGADVVYHFAALMGTSSRFKQEHRTIEVNVLGTLNVLEASLQAGVKYFVHPPRPPLSQWLTPYIISKTAQTQFTQMYHKIYGLPTVGLHIANCYGPRERSVLNPNAMVPREGKKLVATCIIAALKGEPLPVFGDGEQASDFIFIDDVVDACIKAPKPEAIGEVFDIGTGIATKVNDVARLVIKLTKSKSKIEHLPMRTGEVKLETKSDPSLAKKVLGWVPVVSLEEGLKKTIPFYAKALGIDSPV